MKFDFGSIIDLVEGTVAPEVPAVIKAVEAGVALGQKLWQFAEDAKATANEKDAAKLEALQKALVPVSDADHQEIQNLGD